MEPMDVMDQGRMAIVEDPSGATFGLWEGHKHIGAQIVNEPGSMTWNELHTTDSETARRFYLEVFGYEPEPMDGMDYTVLKVEGRSDAAGGIFGTSDALHVVGRIALAQGDLDTAGSSMSPSTQGKTTVNRSHTTIPPRTTSASNPCCTARSAYAVQYGIGCLHVRNGTTADRGTSLPRLFTRCRRLSSSFRPTALSVRNTGVAFRLRLRTA
jgi:predicted enzyme related to lactoylglutathione lyase